MLGARLMLFRRDIALQERIEPLGTILAVFVGCSGVARRAYLPSLTLESILVILGIFPEFDL